MLDLESIREVNKSKFHTPENLKKLLAQEFMLDGRIIIPKLPLYKHKTKLVCDDCIFSKIECDCRIFDDSGTLIPDCLEGYPKRVYYEYKEV